MIKNYNDWFKEYPGEFIRDRTNHSCKIEKNYVIEFKSKYDDEYITDIIIWAWQHPTRWVMDFGTSIVIICSNFEDAMFIILKYAGDYEYN